jgi:hypothetical protein
LPVWEEKRICHRINVLVQFTGLVGGASALLVPGIDRQVSL